MFATYPYPPREIEAGLARPEAFGAWLAELAHRYPQVRGFVVGQRAEPACVLATAVLEVTAALRGGVRPVPRGRGYDALKGVDPTLTVVGVGFSPRGNDRPFARSNVSTSPVRFLAALGAWYRASGRDRPLMDGLSFHPYPNRATDALSTRLPVAERRVREPRPRQAGRVGRVPRHGAADDARGLRLYLDEIGWQVDTAASTGTTGVENVP